MRAVNEIIVHCTATRAGQHFTVADVNAWHLARGWSGIGYHRLYGLNGERWQGRAFERVGAHCEGHNTGTIGIAYVGGVMADGRTPADTRTPAQKEAMLLDLVMLRDRFNIQKVSGHNEYAAKACPSFDASKAYDYLFEGRGKFVPTVDAVLQRGDFGAEVRAWSQDLANLRRRIGHQWPVEETDTFDQTLEMVTRWFQSSRKIVSDGKVGPQTRFEMQRALADESPYQAMFPEI